MVWGKDWVHMSFQVLVLGADQVHMSYLGLVSNKTVESMSDLEQEFVQGPKSEAYMVWGTHVEHRSNLDLV
jgi:hypothetical protein